MWIASSDSNPRKTAVRAAPQNRRRPINNGLWRAFSPKDACFSLPTVQDVLRMHFSDAFTASSGPQSNAARSRHSANVSLG